MKKPLIIATTVVLLISFVGALLIWSYSDAWVAAGIRTYGPRITKTSVNVDSVKLSRDGTGTIRGLVVGNPAPTRNRLPSASGGDRVPGPRLAHFGQGGRAISGVRCTRDPVRGEFRTTI